MAELKEKIIVKRADEAELIEKAHLSGGKIRNIMKNYYEKGYAVFGGIDIPTDGVYAVKLVHADGEGTFFIDTDCGTTRYDSGDEYRKVFFRAGENKIRIGALRFVPELEGLEIYSCEAEKSADEAKEEKKISYSNTELALDTVQGTYCISLGGKRIVKCAYCSVVINGKEIKSTDCNTHEAAADGGHITFTHTGEVTLKQDFYLSEGAVRTRLTVIGEGIKTNRITPLRTEAENGVFNTGSESDAFLMMPFDNDGWVEPKLCTLNSSMTSYECAALLDTVTEEGIVIGSLEHDRWKTGIFFRGADNSVCEFEVYGGIADIMTRDNSPHGFTSGNEVSSPLIYIGEGKNWRDELVSFGKANTEIVPKKKCFDSHVPFGFNSWAVMETNISYSKMTGVSDYIKNNLQNIWTKDGGNVYVNMDSFWDAIVMNDPAMKRTDLHDALVSFVEHCHKNGQRAGIYYTPFACWHNTEEDMKRSLIYDTGYTYYDAALRSTDGTRLYGKLDGGTPLDPTHPATRYIIKKMFTDFVDMGFEYVKLDFMGHGALEGKFYDKSISTGLEAYNSGMKYILDVIGDRMFINLSIAPLFPYQYSDGRRISCDAWANIWDIEHVLSYATFGFFEKEIYNYPDPDHLVVWGKDGKVPLAEARSRVTTGIMMGTSFLTGDDLSSPAGNYNEARERFNTLLGNSDIVAIAKLGVPFRPISVKPGRVCSDAYALENGDETYIALFNLSGEKSTVSADVSGYGISDCTGRELWRNAMVQAEGGKVSFELDPHDSAVIKLGR